MEVNATNSTNVVMIRKKGEKRLSKTATRLIYVCYSCWITWGRQKKKKTSLMDI